MSTFSKQDLDYIALVLAHKLADLLKNPEDEWISQNRAFERHGGRAFVEKLRRQRKVKTRRNANRIEYRTKDLIKYSTAENLKKI